MSLDNVEELSAALENARVSPTGVSFAGKSLKLDSEKDAQQVIDEIDKCKDLNYLNLEGNTLGVEASKGIAKALEKHAEFKRALWKDMFTGRMKTEIPKALEFLGDGLVTAQARLTELDLSDNAFGPIGVQGLASLLRSSSCYALEELRLNNNGLGITGGKLLAEALTDCYVHSKKEGKPLALKVFIAGRNRLENEGAMALAAVFKVLLSTYGCPAHYPRIFVEWLNQQLGENWIGQNSPVLGPQRSPDLKQIVYANDLPPIAERLKERIRDPVASLPLEEIQKNYRELR